MDIGDTEPAKTLKNPIFPQSLYNLENLADNKELNKVELRLKQMINDKKLKTEKRVTSILAQKASS